MTFDPSELAFGPIKQAFDWRLPTREGLTWRLATPDDIPGLHRLWDEMDRTIAALYLRHHLGTPGKQDRPNLFDTPVALTLVAVDDETGEILSAVYGEMVMDWTMIGTSRRVARTIDTLHPTLVMFLFPRKIRVTRILVPLALEKYMAKLLPQMRNITHSVAQFVCNIRS